MTNQDNTTGELDPETNLENTMGKIYGSRTENEEEVPMVVSEQLRQFMKMVFFQHTNTLRQMLVTVSYIGKRERSSRLFFL